MTDPITIHASSLGDWLDCPRRAFLRHHESQDPSHKPRPKVEALVGIAAHRGAQAAIRQGPDEGLAYAAIDTALDSIDWSSKVERELKYSSKTPTLRDAKTQARVISLSVWRTVREELPILMEPETEVEVALKVMHHPDNPAHASLEVEGRLDWLPKSTVVDLKTGSDIGVAQMGAYCYMSASTEIIVIHAPIGTSEVEIISVNRSIALHQAANALSEASRWLTHPERLADTLPTNSHSLLCNGCRWRDSCINYEWENEK